MAKPSHQDAMLMLQFAQWGSASGLPDALSWMWSDEFETEYTKFKEKYPPGSEGYAMAGRICGWYEMLGTLRKHGLFNEELLYDWVFVKGPWERIKGFALGLREEMANPRVYENFEALAQAQ